MKRFALAFLLLATPVWATDPPAPTPPPIILPDNPAPPPVPVPPPSPNATQTIGANEMYVVRSEMPLIIMSSPAGLVTIEASGPLTIRGLFVGGTGKAQKKVFAEKHIYIIEAAKTGLGELIIIPAGSTTESAIVRRLIDCQLAPLPPPVPPIPVPPVPPPDPPDPFAATGPAGLRVLFVYESADMTKYAKGQVDVLYSTAIRDYIRKHALVGADGTTLESRFWDKDIDTAGEDATWQKVMKRKHDTLPWIVVGNGKTGFEGVLPQSVDETLKLLAKYGGP